MPWTRQGSSASNSSYPGLSKRYGLRPFIKRASAVAHRMQQVLEQRLANATAASSVEATSPPMPEGRSNVSAGDARRSDSATGSMPAKSAQSPRALGVHSNESLSDAQRSDNAPGSMPTPASPSALNASAPARTPETASTVTHSNMISPAPQTELKQSTSANNTTVFAPGLASNASAAPAPEHAAVPADAATGLPNDSSSVPANESVTAAAAAGSSKSAAADARRLQEVPWPHGATTLVQPHQEGALPWSTCQLQRALWKAGLTAAPNILMPGN